MKKVNLRMKELNKYNAIKEFVDHVSNKNRVAINLSLSRLSPVRVRPMASKIE